MIDTKLFSVFVHPEDPSSVNANFASHALTTIAGLFTPSNPLTFSLPPKRTAVTIGSVRKTFTSAIFVHSADGTMAFKSATMANFALVNFMPLAIASS